MDTIAGRTAVLVWDHIGALVEAPDGKIRIHIAGRKPTHGGNKVETQAYVEDLREKMLARGNTPIEIPAKKDGTKITLGKKQVAGIYESVDGTQSHALLADGSDMEMEITIDEAIRLWNEAVIREERNKHSARYGVGRRSAACSDTQGNTWEIYEDSASQWRWREIASNGEIVGASGEGYINRSACISNARRNGMTCHPQ